MTNPSVRAAVVACVLTGFVGVGLAAGEEPRQVELLPVESGFGAVVSTDRPVYRVGGPIRITFVVFNHTPTPVRFDFASGQRYDVVIENQAGKEIWRWSAGRMFTMALGQETLGPERRRLVYEAEITERLAPGRYRIKGVLADNARHLSASVEIEVQ